MLPSVLLCIWVVAITGFEPLANDFILIPVFLISGLVSSVNLLSNKIIKKISNDWQYVRFRNVQWTLRAIYWGCLVYFIIVIFITTLFNFQELWFSLLSIVFLNLVIFTFPIQDIMSPVGDAILSLRKFLCEVETDLDIANFRDLEHSMKKVNMVTKKYNFTIKPKKLAMAITNSFFKNQQRTINEINEIICWLKAPRADKNFQKFCEVIENYSKDATMCEEAGMVNESYWTLKRVQILSLLITIIGGILSAVIPIINSL